MNNSIRLSRPGFEPGTFVELLMWRAHHYPERRAFTFIGDDGPEEEHITFAELDRRARAIAALLQSFVATGERAVLVYPPGIDYISAFFGCLYAGVIAVPAYPPDPARLDQTLPRLQFIISDIQATVVLTTAPILALAEFLFDQTPDLGALQWMATDNVASGVEYRWQEPKLTGDTSAYVQYTSGSTRSPKGVMVSHGNLMYNSLVIKECFEITTTDRIVSWLPPYRDMGLIGGLLQPLYSGVPCILMAPISDSQGPFRWLQTISRYRATISGGPNFGYDLCVRHITSEQRATLDLSSWNVAFSGAEPIRAETMNSFTEAFTPCGFRKEAFHPCYGLAEATLIVSGSYRSKAPKVFLAQATALQKDQVVPIQLETEKAQALVSCGINLRGQTIVIVDPEKCVPCPPDKVGEIWVAGQSIAQGLWNQPEETKRTFEAYLADTGKGPFLRTGDLGFFIDGELYITGRRKDLLIIEGLKHSLQDIEHTIENCHASIRAGCIAAFSIEVDHQEQLVVMAEVEEVSPSGRYSEGTQSGGQGNGALIHLDHITQDIQRAIFSNHNLHVYDIVLMRPKSIPKTSSGKVQRQSCRKRYLTGMLEALGN